MKYDKNVDSSIYMHIKKWEPCEGTPSGAESPGGIFWDIGNAVPSFEGEYISAIRDTLHEHNEPNPSIPTK